MSRLEINKVSRRRSVPYFLVQVVVIMIILDLLVRFDTCMPYNIMLHQLI